MQSVFVLVVLAAVAVFARAEDDGQYRPELYSADDGQYRPSHEGKYHRNTFPNLYTNVYNYNDVYNARSGRYFHNFPSTTKYYYRPVVDQAYYASEPVVAVSALPKFAPAPALTFPRVVDAFPKLAPRFQLGDFKSKSAQILRQDSDASADNYHYQYETENGIKVEESGKVEQATAARAGAGAGTRASGFFEFVADDGHQYRVDYTADENGFRPVGAHLPTPPPVPDAIARSLAYRELSV